MLRMLTRAALALALVSTSAFAQQSEVDIWATLLKPKYFPDVELTEGRSIIDMKTPYRSEDAAFTPVSITAGIPQTAERYIEKLYVFVEKNPQPLVGVFTLTPEMGRADLAMRVRVDQYTNVRAVAVLNNGEHHMVKSFVKAQGGCAIPVAIDYKQAMAGLGKIQLRTLTDKVEDGAGLPTQLRIRHPNFTGMQMDYKIYAVRPAHYVNSIRVLLNGEAIMTAETGISISEDPSFRFFVNPDAKGTLTAEITDTKGNSWEESLTL